MDIQEFMEESSRTLSPHMCNDAFKVDTLHGIIGIATEAGELLDAVKKGMFYGAEPDMVNVREEIGDILWYVCAILRSEGWKLEDIMEENISKLRKRYPEQFTIALAKKRNGKDVKYSGFCTGCLYLSGTGEVGESHCTWHTIRMLHTEKGYVPMPWGIKECQHYTRGDANEIR